MDKTFVLYSTMSPQISKLKKHRPPAKVPTKLALKRNIRKSCMMVNLPLANDGFILEESSVDSSKRDVEKIDITTITISDSDDSFDMPTKTATSYNSINTLNAKNIKEVTPLSKFDIINNWVAKVNSENKLTNKVVVSACDKHFNSYGSKEECGSLDAFINGLREELLGSGKLNSTNGSDNIDNDIGTPDIIESSENNLSIKNIWQLNLIGNNCTSNKDAWSEARKKTKPTAINKVAAKTEVRPKTNKSKIRENPCLSTPLKSKFEPSWVKRLELLCDSDSSNESFTELPTNSNKNPTNIRLSFSESENSDSPKDESTSDSIKSLRTKFQTKLLLLDGLNGKQKINDKKIDLDKKTPKTVCVPITSKEIVRKPIKTKAVKEKTSKAASEKPQPKGNKKLQNKALTELSSHVSCAALTSTKSFLASLSQSVKLSECDPTARIFRNSFKTYRCELAKKLYDLYNEKVFDGALPKDAALSWSERMRGTAGYCNCKKTTHKNGSIARDIQIVLASKVLDSADRLRDTLMHEMCHAATWIVDQVSDGHGNYWKAWVDKARRTFPELPPIGVCHNYPISTKYTYKCIQCNYSVGRHSKSLDIERKRCGYCFGRFEIFINKTSKSGESISVPTTPKKQATGFALFVKENYSTVKTPQRNHGQVMKLLGVKYNELKVD